MYCAVCGTLISTELNFYNRCGTKVSKVDLEIQKTVTENLSSALGYIGGFGFLGFIFVIYILVKNDVPAIALTAISLFYLTALFGVCYQIVQRISNLPEIRRHPKMIFKMICSPRKSFQQIRRS